MNAAAIDMTGFEVLLPSKGLSFDQDQPHLLDTHTIAIDVKVVQSCTNAAGISFEVQGATVKLMESLRELYKALQLSEERLQEDLQAPRREVSLGSARDFRKRHRRGRNGQADDVIGKLVTVLLCGELWMVRATEVTRGILRSQANTLFVGDWRELLKARCVSEKGQKLCFYEVVVVPQD